MNRHINPEGPPFPGLETPPPDPRLRSRVLYAARQAASEVRPSPMDRFIDAVWSSRPLHVVWIAATLALLVLNADIDRGRPDVSPHLSPRIATLTELEAAGGDGEMNPRQALTALAREGV